MPTEARPPLPDGPFLVVGLARSGEGIARALRARGQTVIGADAGGPDNPALAAAAQRLNEQGVEVHLNVTGDELAGRAATVVKSPGVPQSAPLVLAARDRRLTVTGELEIAWRLIPNDFIAVTGTNGKTTTTEWIGHVHRVAGVSVAVAGNVGTALSTLVDELEPAATVVCEASSFQLEDTLEFSPQVAVLLNITPDHLDRHGTFEAYREAKLRIFANQNADASAVLPQELEIPSMGGQTVRFGPGPESDLRLHEGELIWRERPLVAVEQIRLPGAHNLQNAMATAAACLVRGLEPDAVAEGLRSFEGVPHRLELVAQRRGVRFVNDSKATNVASTLVALDSFSGGVHLILGGQAKAQDFGALNGPVRERCTAVYLIGEDAPLIASAFELDGTQVTIHRSADLRHAVAAAAAAAHRGEVVLLSPACASFDQFKNFEERGDAFRSLTVALPDGDA